MAYHRSLAKSSEYPPEADQAEADGAGDLEAGVLPDVGLEPLGETAVLADVLLQALHAEGADHEPQLQGAEPATERDAPVLRGA